MRQDIKRLGKSYHSLLTVTSSGVTEPAEYIFVMVPSRDSLSVICMICRRHSGWRVGGGEAESLWVTHTHAPLENVSATRCKAEKYANHF